MVQRQRHSQSQTFLMGIVEHSSQGLKATQVEIIHGTLLTYRELLLRAKMVR